jgi:hypothetical protein
LLHMCTRWFGLRPLVFHVDAGWNTQFAVNNIERLIDALDLDLFTEVIDWEEMRDLQLAYFKAGVPHVDTPQDHAFFATMYAFAERHDIRFILTGGNYATEAIRNPVEWMYYQSDSTQLRDIHSIFGTVSLATFPQTSIMRHKLYLRYVKRIRVVRLLDLVAYDKDSAKDTLIKEYGWQPYPQKHFESRFTQFYESFWLPTKFGFDTRRVQFSSLILTGQMSRDTAIEALTQPPYDDKQVHHDVDFIARKLGISSEELWSYHSGTNRTFRDYKSQSALYSLGARVMRALRLELGGKR